MKKIVRYEAFDGTSFKTEDECLIYEFKTKNREVLEKVNFYDKNGEAIDAYEIFSTGLDKVYFIEIKDISLSSVVAAIDVYYLDIFPYTGEREGFWFWDEEEDRWKMWENEWEKLVHIGKKFHKLIDNK